MSIGKTIARIEDRPTDLEYGYRRDNALLIIFTDGTAMEVEGWSREEVSRDYAHRFGQQWEEAAA